MSKSKTTVSDVTKWFLSRAREAGGSLPIEWRCSICGLSLLPEQKIHWDHIRAEAFDGPHHYTNLRPTHAACNLKKGGRESKALKKIDRLTGKTKGRPKRAWPAGRKMQSRPFQKRKP